MSIHKEMSMEIHANRALLGQNWAQNVRLTCVDARIAKVETGVVAGPEDYKVDALLPSIGNLHSHSFQRAMAGMTEFRAAGRESFWTWRDLMYRFLGHLTPDQFEAIAALVFMEMQEAGYASVGEFHYVHHQPDGHPYAQLSELSDRIYAAANHTGIGLTHLPVLYTYGGVNQEPLVGGQLRFSNDVDRFLTLVDTCKKQLGNLPDDARVGIAPHSLRATSPSNLVQILDAAPEGPVHIHISEQLKEVADVKEKLGKRPVEWLLDNANVNERWCLIHATHMTEAETIAMAKSGAVAGLCPITEANLGDGPFNGPTYLEHEGAFGIGSDSNVCISLTEELRTLEYSQRLRDMARNVMVRGDGSVGQTLFAKAALGGAQALGRDAGVISKGKLADLVAVDCDDVTLFSLKEDRSAGRHMVKSGRHVSRDKIVARYKFAMSELVQSI
jgi:formiminoglutamate deiminase